MATTEKDRFSNNTFFIHALGKEDGNVIGEGLPGLDMRVYQTGPDMTKYGISTEQMSAATAFTTETGGWAFLFAPADYSPAPAGQKQTQKAALLLREKLQTANPPDACSIAMEVTQQIKDTGIKLAIIHIPNDNTEEILVIGYGIKAGVKSAGEYQFVKPDIESRDHISPQRWNFDRKDQFFIVTPSFGFPPQLSLFTPSTLIPGACLELIPASSMEKAKV